MTSLDSLAAVVGSAPLSLATPFGSRESTCTIAARFKSVGTQRIQLGRLSRSCVHQNAFSHPGSRFSRPAQLQCQASLSAPETGAPISPPEEPTTFSSSPMPNGQTNLSSRATRRTRERTTYLVAAVASSIGITALAAGAVVYRFHWQMQAGVEVSYLEIAGTLALAIGAAVGMEYWARWAHRALWHDSLWFMHESHHKPREGPFETNDVFAIINAVPAILLIAYGFFNQGLVPGLCFGAGLGITLFGMAYMFIHDGLVHRRFPVGPLADVPYLQRIAAAHQLHHADKFEGVPFGLFLGDQELVDVGGLEDLEAILKSRAEALQKVSL